MIEFAAVMSLVSACEKFRRERDYGGGLEEAERVVAIAANVFDVVEIDYEPMLRTVLASLRAALGQCNDREMRRLITASIRRGTIMLAEQIADDPKMKPEAVGVTSDPDRAPATLSPKKAADE